MKPRKDQPDLFRGYEALCDELRRQNFKPRPDEWDALLALLRWKTEDSMKSRRDQLDLFRDFAPEPADEGRYLHRRGDPDTSAEAARDIVENLAHLHQWTVACVRSAPGLTQRELGAKFCPTDPRKIGRRLNECEKGGLVRRGPPRTCTVSGRQAETWFPA